MKKKYAIIVAGGSGQRMGTDVPKQFLLLKGKPVLIYSLEAFCHYSPDVRIIVVLPKDQQAYWLSLCKQYHCTIEHQITEGGATRFHSVKNGLAAVEADAWVAVHDGARPLVSPELIAQLFEQAEKSPAVCPAIPVTDTIRRVNTDGSSETVDRSHFFLVQTPQVFEAKTLLTAYQQDYSERFTDDVSVVENLKICRAESVEGSRENLKITTPLDLIVAEALLNGR